MAEPLANRQALAQRIIDRWTGKVAQFWGQGNVDQVQAQYATNAQEIAAGLNPNNVAAFSNAHSGTINFDIQFLKTASRADLRGNIIHELTHEYGVGVGKKNQENYADYARYELNPKEAAYWNPSAGVEAIAKNRGTWYGANGPGGNMTGYGGQGGQQGPQLPRQDGGKAEAGRSARNGAANTYSKGTNPYAPGASQGSSNATLPALSPEQTQNYYQQLSGLASQYNDQLMALKQQRIGAKADFRSQLAVARQQEVAGIAQAEGSALGAGMVGSSSDLANRSGVQGSFAAQRQQLQQQKLDALIQSRLGAQQAATGYAQGVYALQGNMYAAQASAEAQAMANNTIISGQEAQMDFWRKMYQAQLSGQQTPQPVPTGYPMGGDYFPPPTPGTVPGVPGDRKYAR